VHWFAITTFLVLNNNQKITIEQRPLSFKGSHGG